MSSDLGLSKDEVRQEIQRHLDRNADLLIGIDDPEMAQLIEVLCEGFAEAMSVNNKKITHDLEQHNRNAALGFL